MHLTNEQSKFSIHSLVCHQDILPYLYSINSFFYFSKLKPHVFAHNDGTLTQNDIQLLKKHIQKINIIEKNDQRIINTIKPFKYCMKLYKNNVLGKKLFAFLISPTKKIIYLDSDVLFFKKPNKIINWAKNKNQITLFNKDSHYTKSTLLNEDEFALFGVHKIHYFNTGLILMHKDIFNIKLIEKILKYLYENNFKKLWIFEQTVLAILTSKLKYKQLPLAYFFQNKHNIKIFPDIKRLTSKHYSGAARPYLFSEGIRYLNKQNIFIN